MKAHISVTAGNSVLILVERTWGPPHVQERAGASCITQVPWGGLWGREQDLETVGRSSLRPALPGLATTYPVLREHGSAHSDSQSPVVCARCH